MARTRTFYLKDAAASGSSHGSLQSEGSAPTAATTATGATVGKTGATNYTIGQYATEKSNASFGGTALPTAASLSTNDAWRSENLLTGTFESANWTVSIAVRAVTAAASGTGRIRIRLYRSTSATGSGATEITSAVQITTTYSNLLTSADQNLTVTWNPGAVTLAAEYLFLQFAFETVTASGSNTADCLIRVGANSKITTSNFFPEVNDTAAVTDTGTREVQFERPVSDSVSVSDSAVASLFFGRNNNDTISVTDSGSRSATFGRTNSDTAAVSDLATEFPVHASKSFTGLWMSAFRFAPWKGSPSVGASAGRDLATAGSDPTVGTSVNRRTAALFVAGFDPTQDANLYHWLRADLGATTAAGGTELARLNDQSGTGDANKDLFTADGTLGGVPATSNPLYTTSDANFNNQASWGTTSGADSARFMTCAGTFASPLVLPFTVYHALYIPAGGATNFYARLKGGNGYGAAMYGVVGAAGFIATDDSSAAITFTLNADTLYVVCVVYDGPNSAIYLFNYAAPDSVGDTGSGQSYDYLSTGTYNAQASRYREAEIIVSAGAHDATKRAQYASYINTRYGMSIATTYHPTDEGNAILYFDFDTANVTLASGAISQVNDQSGNARHAMQGTAGSRPPHGTGTTYFNGQGYAAPDGSNDSLATGSWTTSAQPTTHYGVSAWDGPTSANVLFDAIAGSATRQTVVSQGGTGPDRAVMYAGASIDGGGMPTSGAPFIWCAKFDSGSSEFYVNDMATPIFTADAGTEGFSSLQLFVDQSGVTQFFGGKHANNSAFAAAHDANTRKRVARYLGEKYFGYPATLAWTGWWEADADVGFIASGGVGTFAARPSASISGQFARRLIEATNPPATFGLNSHNTANFDGTNDVQSSTGALYTEDFVRTSGTWTIAVMFYADTAASANANAYNDPGLISDAYGLNIGFSDGGLGASVYDGAWKQGRVTCSSGAWHVAFIRFNGAAVEVRIDNGSWSSPGGLGTVSNRVVGSASTYRLLMGQSGIGGTQFDGKIASAMIANGDISNARVDSVYSYLKAKFPGASLP